MTGKGFLNTLAASLATLLSNLMEQVFGPDIHTPLFSNVTQADPGVLPGTCAASSGRSSWRSFSRLTLSACAG